MPTTKTPMEAALLSHELSQAVLNVNAILWQLAANDHPFTDNECSIRYVGRRLTAALDEIREAADWLAERTA